MTPFSVLIIGHLIGDFLLQTSWIAKYKARKWHVLIVHVCIYTAVIMLVDFLTFQQLSVWGISIIFLSHIILDRQKFVYWWMRKVMRTEPKSIPWLVIVIDQIFHIIVLACVLL